MAILGKYNYYKTLLVQYIAQRFHLMKFAGLSVLLVVMGIQREADHLLMIENLFFIFASLFVFRLIDDAWSFHLDRTEHPDRIYLLSENFNSFIRLSIILYIIYQAGLFFISPFLGWVVFILVLISSALYIAFYNKKAFMAIIPILKYPVFIWCISRFSLTAEIFLLSIGAFLMMLAVDFFQANSSRTKRIYLKIGLILLTGLIVMQPWLEQTSIGLDLFLIAIPLLFILIAHLKGMYIFPAIIFSIIHFVDLLF